MLMAASHPKAPQDGTTFLMQSDPVDDTGNLAVSSAMALCLGKLII